MTSPSFKLFGSAPHLRIESTADLRHALALDEAHWVAVSAPVDTLLFDGVFLSLLDADGDGRVTCDDVRQAIRWTVALFTDHTGLDQGADILNLDTVNPSHADGARVRTAAEKMLYQTGARGGALDLAAVRKIKAEAEVRPVSEWGVILPAAADDDGLKAFIIDALDTVGGAAHPSGATGIDEKKLTEFMDAGRAFLEWARRGHVPADGKSTEIMPLGASTPDAYAAFSDARGKLDQFFAQCEAVSLDERFVQRMGWQEAELRDLDFDDPAVIENVLAKAPLAKANADRIFCLNESVNPYYGPKIDRFFSMVVRPVLGPETRSMTALQWVDMKDFFSAHQRWVDERVGDRVARLGEEKWERYLASDYPSRTRELIAESDRTGVVLDGVRLVEKAVLFQSLLITFVNNFISFPHLYDIHRRAIFEVGTLVIDGRRFNMAVKVTNRGEHTKMAKDSGMFVLYVELTDEPGLEKLEVSVPVTSGTRGNLRVGKRGVFYDVHGREKNARIVEIIDNPISFTEALSAPLKKLSKILTGKVESWSSIADKKFEQRTTGALTNPTAAPPPATAQPGAMTTAGGMMMGGGVALAALGSAAAYITKTLSEINPWAILWGLSGALAVVFVPLALVAYLKLKRRDLSAILEGSGWAINACMRLTRSQGRYFTQRPAYPKNAKGIPSFVLRRVLIGTLIFLLLLCLVKWGRGQAERLAVKQAPRDARADESVNPAP
ncbi:MAG: hypothetical protein RRC34_05845 [Lentisphaeria bacterium]|nr:hypothetical protein [Lentisphaeria bacterium]